jgi:hypothetical protein
MLCKQRLLGGVVAMALGALGVLGITNPSLARPVSYPGGFTLIQENNPVSSSLLAHYTPNRHYAVGLRLERDFEERRDLIGLQANWLAWRRNARASQANFYVKAGLLAATDEGLKGTADPAGFASVSLDWEDRRYLVMAEAEVKADGDQRAKTMQRFRAGFAPYEGDYGDLHTWLFFDLFSRPSGKDKLTPQITARFFYQTLLTEVGVDDRGRFTFNWTLRF